jgi:hypothetical protein
VKTDRPFYAPLKSVSNSLIVLQIFILYFIFIPTPLDPIGRVALSPENRNNTSRFHLKTETESSLRHVAINKRQGDGYCPQL